VREEFRQNAENIVKVILKFIEGKGRAPPEKAVGSGQDGTEALISLSKGLYKLKG
jgi:hypothetical protein